MKKLFVSASVAAILSGCASGGGGSVNSTPIVNTPAPTPNPTVTDNRYKFDTFSTSTQVPSGEAVVTYKVGEHRSPDQFPKTDKYKIEDFGFLEVSVKGLHSGCPESECGPEQSDPGPWTPGAHQIIESDINADGHMDFYVFESFIGSRDKGPYESIQAFINDGSGHFILSTDKVFADGKACSNQGTWVYENRTIDPECGKTVGSPRHILVADFNNDGMDDIFGGMVLQLSDNGKLYNKTLTNLPDYFNNEYLEPLFKHDQYAGDATGDGNLDIFMPLIQSAVPGKWADGSDIDGCAQCVASTPWALLVNDGAGNFSLNQNFPMFGVGMQHPLLRDHLNAGNPAKGILWGGNTETLWATTAAIGDFDRDGSGDIAVGWYNPYMTKTWGLGENSAGAIYYNDGNNDWRNRPIVPLPASYYGANGNANDMEVMDFDGDGWLDIVLASTKQEPYYDGRVIQFFKNNADGTFLDVTSSVHPDPEKYANGTGTPLWNGEGQLHLVDFNHDGKLDIVDSVNGTYVLLNTGGGKFTMLDHTKFPTADNKLATLFPVELDSKWDYDFISYTTPSCSGDTCTVSYYQVLDPPAMSTPNIYNLVFNDFMSKPASYTTMAAVANRSYTDLFYYSRWNWNNAEVFGSYNNGINTLGGTFTVDNVGFTVMESKSTTSINGNLFNADSDAFGVYANLDKFFAMAGYSHTKLDSGVTSEFFGDAVSKTSANTFGAEVSFKDRVHNFSYSIGARYNTTFVTGFEEEGANVNLTIGDQRYSSANFVATLDYTDYFNYKNIIFYYGADVEYLNYFYSSGANVRASTGGAFTDIAGTNDLGRGKVTASINAGARLTPNTNVLFSVRDTTNNPSYMLSLGYMF